MHWDDWEERIRRERGHKRQEEKPLRDRIHQLEADLYLARQEIRYLQREKRELWERSQALALGTVFPGRELEEVVPPHADKVRVGAPVKGYPRPPTGEGREGFNGKGHETDPRGSPAGAGPGGFPQSRGSFPHYRPVGAVSPWPKPSVICTRTASPRTVTSPLA